MDLNSYQTIAKQTDQVPSRGDVTIGTDIIVPLLGLAGEAANRGVCEQQFKRPAALSARARASPQVFA
jgi:hypothetical protein